MKLYKPGEVWDSDFHFHTPTSLVLSCLGQGRFQQASPDTRLAQVFLLDGGADDYLLSPPVADEVLGWMAGGALITLQWANRQGRLEVDDDHVGYYWTDVVRRRVDRSPEAYRTQPHNRLETAFLLTSDQTFQARFSLYIGRPSRELDALQMIRFMRKAMQRICQLREVRFLVTAFAEHEREVLQRGFAVLPGTVQDHLVELGWQETDPRCVVPAMCEVVWQYLCELEGSIGGSTSDEGLPVDEFTVTGTWDRGCPDHAPALTLAVHNLTPWFFQKEHVKPFLRGMFGACPSAAKSMMGDELVERAIVELPTDRESTFLDLEWEGLATELSLWRQLVEGIRPQLRQLAKLLQGRERIELVWQR